MFNSYKQFIEKAVRKSFNDRKELTQDLTEIVYREHPQDGLERWKSQCYSRAIRELEDSFYQKKNFKHHAEKNYSQQAQKIRNYMNEKARRVPQNVVEERFVKIYLNK